MSDLPTLLPPSSSATMRALETVGAERIAGLDTPIRDLWNVDTCPAALLPWMAWAFSVEVWDHAWAEGVKRNVIREAVKVHRFKGTRRSVELALEALNMRIDLHEGFELDETGQAYGTPHTFLLDVDSADVLVAGYRTDAVLRDLTTQVIANVKPVRSHFSLRIKQQTGGAITVSGGQRIRLIDRATYTFDLGGAA